MHAKFAPGKLKWIHCVHLSHLIFVKHQTYVLNDTQGGTHHCSLTHHFGRCVEASLTNVNINTVINVPETRESEVGPKGTAEPEPGRQP